MIATSAFNLPLHSQSVTHAYESQGYAITLILSENDVSSKSSISGAVDQPRFFFFVGPIEKQFEPREI